MPHRQSSLNKIFENWLLINTTSFLHELRLFSRSVSLVEWFFWPNCFLCDCLLKGCGTAIVHWDEKFAGGLGRRRIWGEKVAECGSFNKVDNRSRRTGPGESLGTPRHAARVPQNLTGEYLRNDCTSALRVCRGKWKPEVDPWGGRDFFFHC